VPRVPKETTFFVWTKRYRCCIFQ